MKTDIQAILLSLLLPALLACNRQETEDTTSATAAPRAIGFGAEVATASTRAAGDNTGQGELTTAMLQQVGFGVYCWFTGTTDFDNFSASQTHISDYLDAGGYMLMRNQKVEYVEASPGPAAWTYSPAKYWPLDEAEKLTFRAYAPYTPYLTTDSRGLPHLPVMLEADDFCRGRQHDPLWGTGKHDAGVDALENNERYGLPYDNYTYAMSGDLLTADSRDGVIDWYFHHGMAKFTLEVMLQTEPPGTEVRVTKVEVGPLYNRGLLDIFTSESATPDDKPLWTDRAPTAGGGNDTFWVTLAYNHNGDHNDLKDVVLTSTGYQNVSDHGLLVIPRNYTAPEVPLTIRVTYTETNTETGVSTDQVAEGHIAFAVQGNTVYALQLLLNAETNALYIRSFINLYWQVGNYAAQEGL